MEKIEMEEINLNLNLFDFIENIKNMNIKGFIEETRKIIKGSSTNTCRFWKYMETTQDQENVAHFCLRLFQILIGSSKDQFLDDDHESMYSTLLLLEFYKNIKQKSQTWLQQRQKFYQENKPRLLEHPKWIINLYLHNIEQSQFALNFLSSLCHVPKKFSWQLEPGQQIQEALKQASEYCDVIEFKRKDKPYKKLFDLSFYETIRQSKTAVFSYCCFLDFIRSSNSQIKKKIWLHVVDILKGMIHAVRHTLKAYELLTVFLFMIGILIKFYGCPYDDILKEIIYYIHILRSSPGVNADLADQMFILLHQELKCAGSAFRRELKRRFVDLDLKNAEELSSRKFYLSFRKINFSSPVYCSLNNLRKLIIYNILGSCKVDNINKLWALVQPLDKDTTYNLYYKIMKIIDIAASLETYENIHKLIRDSIHELFKIGWVPYKKIKKQEEDELSDLINPENPQKYFQFPSFQIVTIKQEDLFNQKYEYSLYSLFENMEQYVYNEYFYSYFLQFIFLGNDEQLSRMLQKISQFLIKVPPKEYQKFAFYIVPIKDGDCYLAQYLATKDLWYRRFVHNVFRAKSLFPAVHLDDPQIQDTFPFYLFTKTLHMYIRSAQRKIPFQIFKCELSFGERADPRTVYFINHILIGASLECQNTKNELKKQKKGSQSQDLLQIYLEKMSRVSPVAVDISSRYKQPGTEIFIKKTQKFMNIEDIQICNTPRPYFFGYKPNPVNQFLQVSILTAQSGKIFKNQLEARQNYKRHSEIQIGEAFRDLFINMTVESILIERSEGSGEMLKLQIDGIDIVDVDKCNISAVYTASKLPLTLPVRCFLPFQA